MLTNLELKKEVSLQPRPTAGKLFENLHYNKLEILEDTQISKDILPIQI